MTADEVYQRIIVTHISTNTAELRSFVEDADRDTARRMYNELRRLTRLLEDKHDFKVKE